MALKALHPTFSIIEVLEKRIDDSNLKKAQRTELRLMKSIAELLDHNPFKEVRNSDISANAGVSYGVLNARFKDKTALAIRLASTYAEELYWTFFNNKQTAGEVEDLYIQIYDQIHYHFRCVENNRGIWRMIMGTDVTGKEMEAILTRTQRHWIEQLIVQLPDQIAGKKPNKKDTELIGSALSGMFDEVSRQFFLKGETNNAYSPIKMTEWVALLRYRAIMGEDPDLESIKRANQLARSWAIRHKKHS